jgi:4,5-dihydroxyphthalate decarboxylase
MATPELTLACRYYDRTAALIAGAVPTPGITLRPVEMTDVAAMFAGLFRGDFDASAMSLGELVYYTSRGLNDFVAIPVFPYRMFRHGYIFRRADAGFTRPEEISGRRVALTKAVVTAGVWMRGMLTDDHGVSASETEWRYASDHHGETEVEEAGLTPRDGSTPRWLTTRADGVHESAVQALVNGEVDALCTTRVPDEITAALPVPPAAFDADTIIFRSKLPSGMTQNESQ